VQKGVGTPYPPHYTPDPIHIKANSDVTDCCRTQKQCSETVSDLARQLRSLCRIKTWADDTQKGFTINCYPTRVDMKVKAGFMRTIPSTTIETLCIRDRTSLEVK